MKTLLAVLLISMAITAQAGKLSQLAAKVPRSLQQAVAVVVCATTCLVGFSPKAYGEFGDTILAFKELSAGYGSGHEHGFLSLKMGVLQDKLSRDRKYDESLSVINIDALATLKRSSKESGSNAYLEHLDTHFATAAHPA